MVLKKSKTMRNDPLFSFHLEARLDEMLLRCFLFLWNQGLFCFSSFWLMKWLATTKWRAPTRRNFFLLLPPITFDSWVPLQTTHFLMWEFGWPKENVFAWGLLCLWLYSGGQREGDEEEGDILKFKFEWDFVLEIKLPMVIYYLDYSVF